MFAMLFDIWTSTIIYMYRLRGILITGKIGCWFNFFFYFVLRFYFSFLFFFVFYVIWRSKCNIDFIRNVMILIWYNYLETILSYIIRCWIMNKVLQTNNLQKVLYLSSELSHVLGAHQVHTTSYHSWPLALIVQANYEMLHASLRHLSLYHRIILTQSFSV